MPELLTVGHGTLTQAELVELLTTADLELLVDVRTAPGSRRHPHVALAAMEVWVPAAGIDYSWERRLGGWRKPSADSPNLALRVDAFRGYADHMRDPEFWDALDGVLDAARTRRTAVMCSETVYWRCHRRLLADAAELARGAQVMHLGHDGRTTPHRLTDGVRLGDDGIPVYDVGETGRLPGL
jgi:uncharacterized protein (DUF488 family)